MSRIMSIENPRDTALSGIFEMAESWMGFLPNDGLLMAHKPQMLMAFFDLAKAVYSDGKVDGGLKRMIGHITSLSAGCQYCSAHTAYGAGKQNVSEEKLKDIWRFQSSSLFSVAEKAALNVALKAGMTPNQVIDEDFDELKKFYDEEAIVEIVSVISLFGFLNRWNSTFATSLEKTPQNFYESIKNKKNE